MKNVWEQKQEEDGQKPKAGFGESLVLWIGGVLMGTIVVFVVQFGLSIIFNMYAAGLMQLVPWVALSAAGVGTLAETWGKRASVFVYVLAGISGAILHFIGLIR